MSPPGEKTRKILSFQPSHPRPVDVQEAIAPRLDHEQKQHQDHGKEQDAAGFRAWPRAAGARSERCRARRLVSAEPAHPAQFGGGLANGSGLVGKYMMTPP